MNRDSRNKKAASKRAFLHIPRFLLNIAKCAYIAESNKSGVCGIKMILRKPLKETVPWTLNFSVFLYRVKKSVTFILLLGASSLVQADAPPKTTFTDHVLPIFKNSCTNCHNPDKKKAGLDLTTYPGTMAGGESGSPVKPGDPGASLIYKLCMQTEEPKMPPKGDKLADKDLEVIKNWVAGFALESMTSKPAAAANKVDVAVVSLTRPEGPAPMPGELPLEPYVRTKVTNSLVALAASPWAPVAAVGGQKQVLLYHTQTLEPLGTLAFPEGFPTVVRFSRNAKMLLAAGGIGAKSGKVVLWDIATGQRSAVVGDETDTIIAADISPNHQFVAAGGPSRLVKIYATKDGSQVASIKKHTDWVTALCFSPEGSYLATGDRNGGIEVWEGATGKPYSTLAGHKVAVTALAFMPGILASSSEDGKIVLWNVKEGNEIKNWAAHPGGALWVDFTSDGRLVSCGRDKVAKVWDQTGKLLATTEALGDLALRTAMYEDRLVAGDWSGEMRVFSVQADKVEKVGTLSSNPPTLAERLDVLTRDTGPADAAVPPLEVQATDLTAKVQTEKEALEAKRVADLAQAEALQVTAQTQLQVIQKLIEAADAKFKDAQGKFTPLQQAMQTATQSFTEKQAAYNKGREMAEAEIAAQAKKLEETKVNFEAKAKALADLAADAPTRPEAEATSKAAEAETAAATQAVEAAKVKLTEATSRIQDVDVAKAAMDEAQKKLAEVQPVFTQAETELKTVQETEVPKMPAMQKVVDEGAAKIATLKTPPAAAPTETEKTLVKTNADLEAARKRSIEIKAAIQKWQQAQMFQELYNARQSLTEKQAKLDETVAASNAATQLLEKTQATMAADEKIVAESPAQIVEKEKLIATAKQEADAAKAARDASEKVLADTSVQLLDPSKLQVQLADITKKLADLQAGLAIMQSERAKAVTDPAKAAEVEAAITAKEKETAPQAVALDASLKATLASIDACSKLAATLPKLQEDAGRGREDYKTRFAKQTVLEQELVALTKTQTDATGELAQLKQRLPQIEADAAQTKLALEQNGPAFTAALEAAKAEVENFRQTYETAKAANQPPTPAPGS